MDFSHVSPVVYLVREDKHILEFKRFRNGNEDKPSPDECKGKLRAIRLDFAFCGEQDFGIEPMAKAFGVKDNKGIITKVPLELVEEEGVRAIKYGRYAKLDPNMIKGAKDAGIIGYWDNSNLLICASPEYGFVIDSIKTMIQPNQVRFAFHRVFHDSDLLILTI